MLALASDILLNPSFPEKEIALYKVRTRAALEEQRSDPDFLREERYAKAIYGDHPASSMGVTRESLEKDDARGARGVSTRATTCPITPSSACPATSRSRKRARSSKRRSRAGRRSGKPRPGVVDPPDHGPMKISLVNRPGSVQTGYMLGEQAINRMHPDYDAMPVMNQILGGSNGRLYPRAARSEGLYLRRLQHPRALRYRGDWRAQMDVRTEVTEPALRDLLAELAKMRDELGARRRVQGRAALADGVVRAVAREPGELLNLYIVRQLYNFPVDYWDRYTDRIMAVTPAQVQAVARKYLDPARLQIVAVGDAARIAQNLKSFGPLEVFDDEGKPVK